MTQDERKTQNGLSVGGLGGISGENVEVNIVQGDQHKGNTVQVSSKTKIPVEVTDALAALRALLAGVEDEAANDLEAVDGALNEAPTAKDTSWAKKGFDALRRLWPFVLTLPDKVEKAKKLFDTLGGFFGRHCDMLWIDTFR